MHSAITVIHYRPLIAVFHVSDKALNTCYINDFKVTLLRIVVNAVFAFCLWVITHSDSSQDKHCWFAEFKCQRCLEVNHEYMLQLAKKDLEFEYNWLLCMMCILVD